MKRIFLNIILIFIFIFSLIWFISQPGYESLIALLVSLSGLVTSYYQKETHSSTPQDVHDYFLEDVFLHNRRKDRPVEGASKFLEEPTGFSNPYNIALTIILCFFIPPLAIYLKNGKIDNAFWINIVLCILGGLPGVLHALYVVLM